MKSTDNQGSLYFIAGGGEAGELIRNHDWSRTSLGAPDQWPQNLRATIGILLHSSFPMILFWGKDLICFYNDAYRPSLGNEGRHPGIGKKGKEVWSENWNFIGPLIEKVISSGESLWFEDQLVTIKRNGKLEDLYWTFSYSPVFGEGGQVDGVFVTCTETTEKITSIQKLKKSQKHLQTLIRESNAGIITLMGENHVIEIVNDAYAKLVDIPFEELHGKPLFEAIPEAEEDFRPILDSIRISGNPLYLFEYKLLIGRDKREGFFNLVYQPYKEENGQTSGVIVQCQDVTEQVLSRRKAETSAQRVRSIVESAPFPIGVYTGKEMRIEVANQALADVWGKGNDLVGKLYSEVLPELESQEIFPQLEGVYTTGKPFHARNQRVDLVVENQLRPFYFNYSFTPLYDGSGKIYGVMNTAAEVTDLNVAKQKIEQSEKNFRSMILQSPVAMCIMTGPQHTVEVANELMIELWGKPSEEVLQRPIFEGLPDARSQGLEQLLDDVYTTGVAFKANERPVELLRNGKLEKVYQNFVYEPYRDSDGTILGVLAISIDVTEQVITRQKIEEMVAERTEELEQANKDLHKSNAELAQFAYIASHDLQEPLRKIITFTQMLESHAGDRCDEQSKKYLDKIRNSASRMNKLIRDVLAYSELVKESDIFKPVDLNEVVENAIFDFELLIEQKGASVQYEKLPEVEAIPLQMSQLFGNIISNSLKFARLDTPLQIAISVNPLSADDREMLLLEPSLEYFNISVRDNGIGFKPEYAEQIFNIFQRLHGKSEYEGTGIGLAMCKKIALNHHGQLNASGSSENGAVFNIILPAKQPVD